MVRRERGGDHFGPSSRRVALVTTAAPLACVRVGSWAVNDCAASCLHSLPGRRESTPGRTLSVAEKTRVPNELASKGEPKCSLLLFTPLSLPRVGTGRGRADCHAESRL